MEDLIHYTELYDLYKNLLTENQRRTFEDYFEENLTIEEIAENSDVSKNAVFKTIKNTKETLDKYEESIHMKEYIASIKNEFLNDEDVLIRISKYDSILS